MTVNGQRFLHRKSTPFLVCNTDILVRGVSVSPLRESSAFAVPILGVARWNHLLSVEDFPETFPVKELGTFLGNDFGVILLFVEDRLLTMNAHHGNLLIKNGRGGWVSATP